MKNSKWTKTILLLLVCVLIAGAVGAADVTAASKRATACKAYRSFLKKNVSKFKVEEGDWSKQNKEKRDKCSSFLLADLNNDGMPELVTYHETGYKTGYLNVYTYKKGKVTYIKTKKNNRAKIDVSCNAAGWYTIYACKKGHLHTDWEAEGAGKDYTTYNLKSGKLNKRLHGVWDELEQTYKFYENGKSIKEERFNQLYGKCKKAVEMHSNTAKMRTKHVK